MKVLATIFVMFSTSVYAGLFDNKLTLYSCNSLEDANACNSSCSKIGRTVEYKVDKKQSKIFVIYYEDGKQVYTTVYENKKPYNECSIFDDKNWKCDSLIPSVAGVPGSHSTQTMANGRVALQRDNKTFGCAK